MTSFICDYFHNDAPIVICIYIQPDIEGLITDSYNIVLVPSICWVDVLMALAMQLCNWCIQCKIIGNGKQDAWSLMQGTDYNCVLFFLIDR